MRIDPNSGGSSCGEVDDRVWYAFGCFFWLSFSMRLGGREVSQKILNMEEAICLQRRETHVDLKHIIWYVYLQHALIFYS